jgi:4-amino-4-deoxy-L-arabinose transferase-like glycosyltransferase
VGEREWREAIDMRSSLLSVGLVVLAGALLRCWNLSEGSVSPIESQIIDTVVGLVRTGTYHPQALTRPTLPLYLQAFVAIVHFLWGAVTGVWRSVSEFGPLQVLTWGRGTSAFLGTAVVFLVFQIGMRWGARHALLGAGLMAVSPTHVAASRAIGHESPLTFFAALTLLLSLVAIERGRPRAFAAAGAAAGFAAASHYAGALLIMLPLLAVWMTMGGDTSRPARALGVLVAALAAFLITNPLSIWDLPAFLNGFAVAASPAGLGLARVDLLQQLLWAMQWPGMILAFAGVTLAVVRAITGPGHTRWTLLASFPLVYFAVVAWHGSTSDAVLLPLLPSVSVLAAIAVVSGVSLLRRFDIPRAARAALIAALTVVAVLPPAVFAIELVRQAGHEAGRR